MGRHKEIIDWARAKNLAGEGKTVLEIAEELGVSLGNLRRRSLMEQGTTLHHALTGQPLKPPPKHEPLTDKKFNWSEVEQMFTIGVSVSAVSRLYGMSQDQIKKKAKRERGQNIYAIKAMCKARGEIGLRQAQFKAALAGNTSLLIWLGRQMLGQGESGDGPVKDQKIEFTIVNPVPQQESNVIPMVKVEEKIS